LIKLFEDFESDEEKRKEAADAIQKVYSILEKITFLKAPIVNLSVNKQRKPMPALYVPGAQIDEKYNNLSLFITVYEKNPGLKNSAAITSENNYAIVVSIPNVSFTMMTLEPELYFKTRSSYFYHEFIHYLDYLRFEGKPHKNKVNQKYYKRNNIKITNKNRKDLLPLYFNDPLEYNAFSQAAFQMIITQLKKRKKDIKNILTDFSMFWKFLTQIPSDAVREIFDKDNGMFSYLNDNYKRKFLKRVYSLYIGLREKLLGKEKS
jgi:hypothetical protein